LDVRVHCLSIGGVDLTSPAGKMTMQVVNAIAEFERDLLIERTNSGIKRAKAAGKKLGRPSALTDAQKSQVLNLLAEGMPVAQLARQFDTARQTIMRIRAA
jgi:putative DNA-invertase from lambdoid prophage Rac